MSNPTSRPFSKKNNQYHQSHDYFGENVTIRSWDDVACGDLSSMSFVGILRYLWLRLEGWNVYCTDETLVSFEK